MKKRTKEEIQREYGQDKWGTALALFKAGVVDTVDEAFVHPDVINVDETIHNKFTKSIKDSIDSSVAQDEYDIILEFGCGIGIWSEKLASLAKESYLGIELTETGVECARLMNDGDVVFMQGDYNDEKLYIELEKKFSGKKVLLFSCQAFEQVPSALTATALISGYLNPDLLLFEAVYEFSSDEQKLYIEENDYCRDLLTRLECCDYHVVITEHPHNAKMQLSKLEVKNVNK